MIAAEHKKVEFQFLQPAQNLYEHLARRPDGRQEVKYTGAGRSVSFDSIIIKIGLITTQTPDIRLILMLMVKVGTKFGILGLIPNNQVR